MANWKTLSSEKVYENPWYSVRRDLVLDQNGKELTYSVVDLPHPSVFVVAIDNAGNILVQQEYKYPINKVIWSIPAGHSDGEDALTAAKRELMEEAGVKSDDWVNLGRQYQTVGIANMPFDVLVAKNAQQISQHTDQDEHIITQKFVSLDELESMIINGEFDDAPAIAAIYMAKLHGLIGG